MTTERDRDPFDTLRSLRDAAKASEISTDGMRCSDLARFEVRLPEYTQADLDRYWHDGLVATERDPMGSVWYSLTEAGVAALYEADSGRVAPIVVLQPRMFPDEPPAA